MACKECSQRDVFVIRDVESRCECNISEITISSILSGMIKRWIKSSKGNQKSIDVDKIDDVRQILEYFHPSECADDFIVGKDADIIDAVIRAIRYLLGSKKLRLWEYLDVGCGTYVPTISIARELGTYPLGTDYMDRRRCGTDQDYFSLIKDNKIPYGDDMFLVATMCDVLHHSPDPESLMMNTLKNIDHTGYIIIIDHDCENWRDHYYLDVMHFAYSKAVGDCDYLPVHGYRSRRYWTRFMDERGYNVVYHDVCFGYNQYIDVYKKR